MAECINLSTGETYHVNPCTCGGSKSGNCIYSTGGVISGGRSDRLGCLEVFSKQAEELELTNAQKHFSELRKTPEYTEAYEALENCEHKKIKKGKNYKYCANCYEVEP